MASDQSGSPFISIEDLNDFNGHQFEHFLVSLFKNMGYAVQHTHHYQGTKGQT